MLVYANLDRGGGLGDGGRDTALDLDAVLGWASGRRPTMEGIVCFLGFSSRPPWLCLDEVKRGEKVISVTVAHCSTFRLFVVNIILP